MSGYSRLRDWEGRSVQEWETRWSLPGLVALRQTASTNDVARALADQGAPAGLLVMTEHQTAGRGRMQRPWADVPGRSLLLSFVLRPDPSHEHRGGTVPGTAPLRVGLAVARALHDATGLRALLKWPNDVVVAGGKLAGILCEAVSSGIESLIIAGIGMNVLQVDQDWPAELKGQATSVAEAVPGATPARPALVQAVVAAMRPLFTRPLEPLAENEILEYDAIDALRGRQVVVSGAVDLQGTAAGIAPDGAMLIDTAEGIRRVTSGTVRAARPLRYTTARKPQ